MESMTSTIKDLKASKKYSERIHNKRKKKRSKKKSKNQQKSKLKTLAPFSKLKMSLLGFSISKVYIIPNILSSSFLDYYVPPKRDIEFMFIKEFL